LQHQRHRNNFFAPKEKVPSSRKVTYGRIVSSIRPWKTKTHHTCLTVGGNRLDYPGNVSTPTAKLTTAKCLINSTREAVAGVQGAFGLGKGLSMGISYKTMVATTYLSQQATQKFATFV
jgi:hypothetical protein